MAKKPEDRRDDALTGSVCSACESPGDLIQAFAVVFAGLDTVAVLHAAPLVHDSVHEQGCIGEGEVECGAVYNGQGKPLHAEWTVEVVSLGVHCQGKSWIQRRRRSQPTELDELESS